VLEMAVELVWVVLVKDILVAVLEDVAAELVDVPVVLV
jgi:hypothetical protein